MNFLKQIFNFYINASIHVAFAVFALVQVSSLNFNLNNHQVIGFFAFFGTIAGYNFVKYENLARNKTLPLSKFLIKIITLSIFSVIMAIYYFFKMEEKTQLFAIISFVIILLYTLPFFPNRKNMRNWGGIKIYIVSLCWVGVTLVLPVINTKTNIDINFFITCLQRFILVFTLVLIFEIIDVKTDDKYLKTVPQQIGIQKTKYLGYFLIFFLWILEFIKEFSFGKYFLIYGILGILIILFLAFADEKKSKYYTSFWAESIPILWWILLILVK